MGVPTMDKDHLVMNVSECFFCPDQFGQKLFTYVHHCSFLSDRKFEDYCELRY